MSEIEVIKINIPANLSADEMEKLNACLELIRCVVPSAAICRDCKRIESLVIPLQIREPKSSSSSSSRTTNYV